MTSRFFSSIILHFFFLVAIRPAIGQNTNSVFFKIEGKGIKPVYIFGVSASAEELTYSTGDSVYIGLSESDAIMSVSYPDSIAMEEFKLPEGVRISDLLNNTKLGRIEEQFLAVLNKSLWKYEKYQPLFLRDLMVQAWQKKKIGPSIKDFLLMLAAEQQKEYLPVSGYPEINEFYRQMPLQIQADILVDFVVKSGNYERLIKKMTGQYLSGNPDKMAMIQKTGFHFEYYNSVCRKWIEILSKKIIDKGFNQKLFVVINGEWLGGKHGLISVMKDKGFKVSPIRTDFSVLYVPNGNQGKDTKVQDTSIYVQNNSIDYYDLHLDYNEEYFASKIPTWYSTTSFSGTFSIKTPEPPAVDIEYVPLMDGSMKVYLYKYDDKAINSFYVVSYNDYPPNFRESIEGDFFRQVVTKSVEKLGGSLLMEKNVSTPEFEGREIEVLADREFVIRAKFYLVGNRMYQVMLGATQDRAYTKENDAYFRSFRIINDSGNKWFELNLGQASVYLPEEPSVKVSKTNSTTGEVLSHSYEVHGAYTNLDYILNVTYYPEKFKVKNLETFYRKLLYTTAESINGVMINEKDVKFNKFSGKYMEFGSGTDLLYRGYFLFYNGRLYQLMVRGTEDSAYSNFAEKFLQSFKLSPLEY